MDTEKRVTDFVVGRFVRDNKNIGQDDSLLDSGLIDSVGIFELIGFLETEFGVEVDDEEIVPDNFETIGKLVAFVDGKTG